MPSLTTHLTAPTIKLLDKRSARGSGGSAIRLHSSEMSAVITERRGNFLKDDLGPNVEASLIDLVSIDTPSLKPALPEKSKPTISARKKFYAEKHGWFSNRPFTVK